MIKISQSTTCKGSRAWQTLNISSEAWFSKNCVSVILFTLTGVNRFQRLFSLPKCVLVLPYSSADAERVFSVVGINKTKTKKQLGLRWNTLLIMMLFDQDVCLKPQGSLITNTGMLTEATVPIYCMVSIVT